VTARESVIAKGQDALARSDWEAARAAFERAVAAEETPEALEGLGFAAFWLADAATVFPVRERAYRLYQQLGDRRGAGRVALSLADDCLNFRGESAVARGWLRRAGRLLGGLPPIPEQGWAKLWEGYLALVTLEDPVRIRKAARAGSAVGRRLRDVDLEMTGLALEGLALILLGDLAEGMPCLDEATAAVVSGEMVDPVAISRSSCLLVLACEYMRDFERAAQWCRRLEEFSVRMRFDFPLALCRTHYAGVLTWRGSWAEAEQELQTALRQPAAICPGLRHEATHRLAELRRLQGRFDESEALLRRIAAGHPLALLGGATLALDRSQPSAAARLAERFLRQVPALNRTDRMAALEVLLRAQLAVDRERDARATARTIRSIAGRVGTEPMRASALAAQGLLAAATGDAGRARRSLEDAIAHFVRSGAPFEAARCRLDLAAILVARGEREAADAELREAISAFDRLGARHWAGVARGLQGKAGTPTRRNGMGPAPRLTRREVEVLRLVAQGMSNQRIAERLVVSPFTVKRHVANLLAKLGVPSRAAAAAHAAREGLA
jgi:DNA-binding CsgD family transcriptional regulator